MNSVLDTNNQPLVSIIIPTYNNANTICRAMNSCINQTYKNIEIIVIDDGSTDNTKDVLNQYTTDERFKYIYQENQERSAARNHGLDIAKGEYIQFLDSDDEIYPDKIEKQVKVLDSNPDCCLVYCGTEYKNRLGLITRTLEPNINGNIDTEILKKNFLVINSPLLHKTSTRFNKQINRLEDWEFWMLVVKNKKVIYLNNILCTVYLQKQTSQEYTKSMLKGEIALYVQLLKSQKIDFFKFCMYVFKRYLKILFVHVSRS